MITRLSAFYDESNHYFVNVTTGGFGVTTDEKFGTQKYITGLLNSKLLDWFMKQVSTSFHGGYFAANKQFLVQLPIHPINFSDAADKARHDKMVTLVERMLGLHKSRASAHNPQEADRLTREVQPAADGEIDGGWSLCVSCRREVERGRGEDRGRWLTPIPSFPHSKITNGGRGTEVIYANNKNLPSRVDASPISAR